jgi:DNA helicase-2/ATP-dependent DNA helicase PcrA
MGDRHVYGARSRFLTRAVMACFDEVAWGEAGEAARPQGATPSVDMAGRLKGMWA